MEQGITKRKKLLTLEEKFEKYKNRQFTVRLNVSNPHNCRYRIKIMGYVKNNDTYLIGKLVGKQGLSSHFTDIMSFHYIEDHEEGNNYVYVALSCLEKYPEVKKTVKKSSRSLGIEDIDSIDFF